jgi:hypothetical protein
VRVARLTLRWPVFGPRVVALFLVVGAARVRLARPRRKNGFQRLF